MSMLLNMGSSASLLRRLVPLALLASVVGVAGFTARAQGYILAADPDITVLFIGNSHTHVNDVPGSVVELAAANGVIVDVEVIAPGGYTLRRHAADANVQAALASGDYDVVVIQEQSQKPAHHSDFIRETAPAADAMARTANASDTRIVYYQTWGRRDGDLYTGHATFGEMQSALTNAYDTLATDTGGTVAPVGETWRYVRDVAPHIELFDADGNHAAAPGSYLAAIVLTETIVEIDLVEAPAVGSIDDDLAGFLLNYANFAPTS